MILCFSSALNVVGDVEYDEGSASISACELGCTGALGCEAAFEEALGCNVIEVLVLGALEAWGWEYSFGSVGISRVLSKNTVFRRTLMSGSKGSMRMEQDITRSPHLPMRS